MTIPTIREFTDRDAQVIERFPLAGKYVSFEPTGPAFTLELEGKIMACVGYEPESGIAKCWMILSPESVKHPRVFWAIRSLLDEVHKIGYKRIMSLVDISWPEARRFNEWMGFSEISKAPIMGPDEKFYTVYERVA